MPPRWKTCTREVDRSLGEALGQEFVRRTFSADMKARTQLMTTQIETAMQTRSRASTGWAPRPRKKPSASSTPSATRSATPTPGATTPRSTIKPDDYFGNVVRAADFEDAAAGTSSASPSTATSGA